MKIASWNVNSIRAREERLLKWLDKVQPDVVCLQEIKVVDAAFPVEAMRAAGYYAVVHGQKTYNGVAILSKSEPSDINRGFGDGAEDAQSRILAASVEGIRVVSVYVPNGAEVGSEKYAYKLAWLDRLNGYLERETPSATALVICGDFNIAPESRDVASPEVWEGSVLFNPAMREAFQEILRLGLVDTFRLRHDEGGFFSWWDYRQLGFPRNDGLRIDHVLATRLVAERCTECWIDREERKGEKPSDHAPVVAVFNWPGLTLHG
jgi:exodeoxyribonuclease-3